MGAWASIAKVGDETRHGTARSKASRLELIVLGKEANEDVTASETTSKDPKGSPIGDTGTAIEEKST